MPFSQRLPVALLGQHGVVSALQVTQINQARSAAARAGGGLVGHRLQHRQRACLVVEQQRQIAGHVVAQGRVSGHGVGLFEHAPALSRAALAVVQHADRQKNRGQCVGAFGELAPCQRLGARHQFVARDGLV